MYASTDTNTAVKKGDNLSDSCKIPLITNRDELDRVVAIAKANAPVFEVKPLKQFQYGFLLPVLKSMMA